MTDRDEELGAEAARKGKGKAEGKQNGGQPGDRGKGKTGDRDGNRGEDRAQGRERGQGQGQDKNRSKDHEKAPAKTSATAEEKDQARNARRSANQLARETARAERQAERAQRKQDRAKAKAAQPVTNAQPAKNAGIADKNRNRPPVPGGDRADADDDRDRKADRKAAKKPGQGAKNRNADPKPAGFVPFAPASDATATKATPAAVFDTPRADVESAPFNILLIGQSGPLARQAVIFAASLRMFSPKWRGRLIVAEPQPDGAWSGASTRIGTAERTLLQGYGAEILPFTARHFGRSYPYGNKIEALALLPAGEPFVFFDSDTIITGPLGPCAIDFSRPTASMRREGSWPEPPLYGPGYADIWRSLYDRFGLDFQSSLDPDQPDEHWERYLYFNAGWFLGDDPVAFGTRFLDWALAVRNDPGEALASQSLDPWLDQAVLPLVIHALGGSRPGAGLDGFDNGVTCHYRNLSLLYAREPDGAVAAMEQVLALPELRDLLAQDAACDQLVRQRGGRDRIRPIFAGKPLPSKEKAIRQELKKQGLWFGR